MNTEFSSPCFYSLYANIDTHGLAILNQFREHFPHSTSLLMDRQTLLAHRKQWETESHPESASLTMLTEAKQSLPDFCQLVRKL
jgi:hypothetical protein